MLEYLRCISNQRAVEAAPSFLPSHIPVCMSPSVLLFLPRQKQSVFVTRILSCTSTRTVVLQVTSLLFSHIPRLYVTTCPALLNSSAAVTPYSVPRAPELFTCTKLAVQAASCLHDCMPPPALLFLLPSHLSTVSRLVVSRVPFSCKKARCALKIVFVSL